MIYTELTKKALELSFQTHKNQRDKAGAPYVYHPFHLAEQMDDEYSTCVALLHDVVEDSIKSGEPVTLNDLRNMDFPDEVVQAIALMTHEKSVPYMDYVQKIKSHPIARKVKLEDLRHNRDYTRLTGPFNDAVIARNRKYTDAIEILDLDKLPNVELMPASIKIETKQPEDGWWDWRISIHEELYQDYRVIHWPKGIGCPRHFDLSLYCSHVFDPVPKLHEFITNLLFTSTCSWYVDEEGKSVKFTANYLNCHTVQARICSSGYWEDYCYDLVLDRDSFIKSFSAAYHSFGVQGGWGNYGDWADEADFPGPKIQINSAKDF